jgi:hypothetical protein
MFKKDDLIIEFSLHHLYPGISEERYISLRQLYKKLEPHIKEVRAAAHDWNESHGNILSEEELEGFITRCVMVFWLVPK